MFGLPVLIGGILKISYPVILYQYLYLSLRMRNLDFVITNRVKIMIDTCKFIESILEIGVLNFFGLQIIGDFPK